MANNRASTGGGAEFDIAMTQCVILWRRLNPLSLSSRLLPIF